MWLDTSYLYSSSSPSFLVLLSPSLLFPRLARSRRTPRCCPITLPSLLFPFVLFSRFFFFFFPRGDQRQKTREQRGRRVGDRAHAVIAHRSCQSNQSVKGGKGGKGEKGMGARCCHPARHPCSTHPRFPHMHTPSTVPAPPSQLIHRSCMTQRESTRARTLTL